MSPRKKRPFLTSVGWENLFVLVLALVVLFGLSFMLDLRDSQVEILALIFMVPLIWFFTLEDR